MIEFEIDSPLRKILLAQKDTYVDRFAVAMKKYDGDTVSNILY